MHLNQMLLLQVSFLFPLFLIIQQRKKKSFKIQIKILKGNTNVGAIVGGVIGGVVFLVIVIAIIVVVSRKKKSDSYDNTYSTSSFTRSSSQKNSKNDPINLEIID